MKRVLGWVVVFVLVVGGATATFWPVPTWRLYDANWQPLVMTEAESYCVGRVLAENGFNNTQNDPKVKACIEESVLDNATPNISKAIMWACQGIKSVDPSWSLTDCGNSVYGFNIWFLLHGGYTRSWNDQNPRPDAAYSNIREAPRGERNDNNRQTEGRFN